MLRGDICTKLEQEYDELNTDFINSDGGLHIRNILNQNRRITRRLSIENEDGADNYLEVGEQVFYPILKKLRQTNSADYKCLENLITHWTFEEEIKKDFNERYNYNINDHCREVDEHIVLVRKYFDASEQIDKLNLLDTISAYHRHIEERFGLKSINGPSVASSSKEEGRYIGELYNTLLSVDMPIYDTINQYTQIQALLIYCFEKVNKEFACSCASFLNVFSYFKGANNHREPEKKLCETYPGRQIF